MLLTKKVNKSKKGKEDGRTGNCRGGRENGGIIRETERIEHNGITFKR